MSEEKYWVAPSGMKSFAVWKTQVNGMTHRVGLYRTYEKAERVRLSLVNPIPHIVFDPDSHLTDPMEYLAAKQKRVKDAGSWTAQDLKDFEG